MAVWRLNNLPRWIIQLENAIQFFLDFLRHSSTGQSIRAKSTGEAYVAYQIWLSKNNRVFKSRNISMRFVPERIRIQVTDVIGLHLEKATSIT